MAAYGHEHVLYRQSSLVKGDYAIMHKNDLFVKSCERRPIAAKAKINHGPVDDDIAQLFIGA